MESRVKKFASKSNSMNRFRVVWCHWIIWFYLYAFQEYFFIVCISFALMFSVMQTEHAASVAWATDSEHIMRIYTIYYILYKMMCLFVSFSSFTSFSSSSFSLCYKPKEHTKSRRVERKEQKWQERNTTTEGNIRYQRTVMMCVSVCRLYIHIIVVVVVIIPLRWLCVTVYTRYTYIDRHMYRYECVWTVYLITF